MADDRYDMVIIGSGVSGLGAAVYAGRFQMKTVVIGDTPGGTVVSTDEIANWPGEISITGLDLATKIEKHAKEYKVEVINKKVTKVEMCHEGCFTVHAGETHYHTKTILFTTGTKFRKLGIPGEKEFANKGVHYCALCDAPFYQDKIVAVVGGSDSAAKESLLIAKYATKVYILNRGDDIRPEPINKKKVLENEKIEVINNVSLKEIKGDKFFTSVTLDREVNGSKEFPLDGLFIEVGRIPLTDLAKDIGVKLNAKAEIIIDQNSKTNIKGVYAAGDCVSAAFKQAITGVGEGVTAAFSAYHYINENDLICYCGDDNERPDNKEDK